MSEAVKTMFSNISGKYDAMNDILSFGIHRLWRRITVKNAKLKPHFKVLDCATGTGDLAIAFKKKLIRKNEMNNFKKDLMNKDESIVIGTDFCEDMLVLAQSKTKEKNIDVKFEFADVMNLQFPNEYFDVSSISFGIRNVDNPKQGISEMARVVKSGGKVLILEFGQPTGWFAIPYKCYSNKLMPFFGKLITGNEFAYTYLPETAAKFPSAEKFLEVMKGTNAFTSVSYKKLSFGIAFLYIGIVK